MLLVLTVESLISPSKVQHKNIINTAIKLGVISKMIIEKNSGNVKRKVSQKLFFLIAEKHIQYVIINETKSINKVQNS